MAKLIIILGLILFLGGSVFAQEEAVEERTIVDVLRTMFPEATIEVEPITSTLIVKAPPILQARIEEMIGRLDIYHPQITIEAKFVELTVTDINELGIDLDIPVIRMGSTLDEGRMGIRNIDNWAETAGTSFAFTRGLDPTAFTAILRALEKQDKVNVLSAPRVTTLNGQPATIEIVQNIPFISEVETVNVGTAEHPIWQTNFTIEEEPVGVFLEVTPTVPEGSDLITLNLRPTVNVLTGRVAAFHGVAAEHGWPIIDTRTVNTSMTVRSGESIVLGGLIRSSSKVIETKVPVLGSLPLLGHFFRHEHSREVKTNLLIFITAYLVSPRGEKIVFGR